MESAIGAVAMVQSKEAQDHITVDLRLADLPERAIYTTYCGSAMSIPPPVASFRQFIFTK